MEVASIRVDQQMEIHRHCWYAMKGQGQVATQHVVDPGRGQGIENPDKGFRDNLLDQVSLVERPEQCEIGRGKTIQNKSPSLSPGPRKI
jgi:hypothetical protein